jgi:hypothetical protein
MRVSSVVRDQLAARFEVLLPHSNERQQRLALATEARLLGHGGVRAVAEMAGVSVTTVRKGVFELEGGEHPLPDDVNPAWPRRDGADSSNRRNTERKRRLRWDRVDVGDRVVGCRRNSSGSFG